LSKKVRYVLIYGLVSITGFFKSYIFLDYFDFADLGLINLCQNFIITISLLQVGIITGGFRLFAYKKVHTRKIINSTVMLFFILLYVVLNLFILCIIIFTETEIAWYWYFIFINIGVLSLYANWVNSKLIALRHMEVLNIVNLTSAVISISVVFLAPYLGVLAAISTFFLQSFTLILLSYALIPSVRPAFSIEKSLRFGKLLVSIGFIPYFTGAVNYFNSQFGRWLITIHLGLVLLGKTSLVGLFGTVANVIPNAISNLYFPDMIASYERRDFSNFEQIFKRYFLIITVYVISVTLMTIALGELVVGAFFPKHLESLPLVYASLPAIGLTFMCNPVVLVMNAMKKFKNILTGSLISVTIFLILVLLYVFLFEVELIGFFIIESISALIFFIYNYYLLITSISHEYKGKIIKK
jgi:O-antigen/teichoic acid export membrane protein